MKVKVIVTAFLFISTISMYGSITEKLKVNADKIAELRKDVKSGNLKAKFERLCSSQCGRACKRGIQPN